MLHAWTLELSKLGVHDALHLMVDTFEGRRQWPAGEDHRAALAASGSTRFRRMPTPYRYLCCGDLRSSGVTEQCNGPLGLHDNDDDDDDWNQEMFSKLFSSFSNESTTSS